MVSRHLRLVRSLGLITMLSMLLAMVAAPSQPALSAPPEAPTALASAFLFYKFVPPQPGCTGFGLNVSETRAYSNDDCGFVNMVVEPAGSGDGIVKLRDPNTGNVFAQTETFEDITTPGEYQFDIEPTPDWPAGEIAFEVYIPASQPTASGGGSFFHNALGGTVTTSTPGIKPGEPIQVSGTIIKMDSNADLASLPNEPGSNATFDLVIKTASGATIPALQNVTADSTGAWSATIPGNITSQIQVPTAPPFQTGISVEAVDASTSDGWAAKRLGGVGITVSQGTVTPATGLLLENSFVSSVGWVKPGDTYTFRLILRNFATTPATNVKVTMSAPAGAQFLLVTEVGNNAGDADINGTRDYINWDIPTVEAGSPDAPTIKTLVVQARALHFNEDPQIVWKNLSTTAKLTYTGQTGGEVVSTSHGPKVIPQDANFDTARYGDRPFPVVPVDYTDRKHQPENTGARLDQVINDPNYPGSTFNLYQEMSFRQLFPNGTVPSSGIASASFDYAPGFQFTTPEPNGTCKGVTYGPAVNEGGAIPAVYDERITDGWYQLPGTTEYYGGDTYGSAVAFRIVPAPTGPLGSIDEACGPIGKAVYDAANIADPEIDYNDFDTDKDGVVDFFMMVFVGCGGNGASQLSPALCTELPNQEIPYDNIWPHSASLELQYSSVEGNGYVSDDQLKDLQGRPLFWSDERRTTQTTTPTAFPVYVRVGPYNVNPESAIIRASVISHEYGHSLGLPDFYSSSGRETYGTWNLMASDYSQHMDIFGKQELGWIVPEPLKPGTSEFGIRDSKFDTGKINWIDPYGRPYTLEGPGIHNGQAFTAKLPTGELIDPQKIIDGASPPTVWWSGSGNDFNCPPLQGHNLDIILPKLKDVPAGTAVDLTFNSLFFIEWDYDYGFVLVSLDGGETYQSLASNRTPTPTTTSAAINPNNTGCQTQYGNGITGSSTSYQAGIQQVTADRLQGNYPDPVFIQDSFRLPSAAAGQDDVVLRFSYATDPGLAFPGWFIDDIKVSAGSTVVFETDLEGEGGPEDPAVFNGACKDGLQVGPVCTPGWILVNSALKAPFDHGYYMEMRDRSGFDFDAKGQSDRGPITFLPGFYLMHTDEQRGYGNTGTGDPPVQTPLDSQPQPGNDSPNLDDAAWTAASGDNAYSDADPGHVDNYTDPDGPNEQWVLNYNCLSFQVLNMLGADVGPAAVPGNLQGTVRFTTGSGCAPFDYGVEEVPPVIYYAPIIPHQTTLQ